MALVLDTGVLYAILDGKQPAHDSCLRLVAEANERLIVPDPVLVELDYLVRKTTTVETWRRFVDQVVDETYGIFPLGGEALVRAAELEVEYADLNLGFVDASVVAVCEQLSEERVATLDRRHFSIVRTKFGRLLSIVPD